MPCFVYGQLGLNVQLPAGGLVPKDQMWNLILINSGDLHSVSIRLSLRDEISGQVLLSANSSQISIEKGVKSVTYRDIQPIDYYYNSPEFEKSYLPMGTYIACYQLYENLPGHQLPLVEECTRINISPLSPPILNSPANNSELENSYPFFTWMPPSPFDMFSNLSYDFIITEILPGQSAIEAIQYNTPIYSRNGIINPNESYSSSYARLDTGKTYAWQVIARNGTNYTAKTEVWTFSLKQEKKKENPIYNNYILLDDKVQGNYVVVTDSILIKFYSYHAGYDTQVKLIAADGKEMKSYKVHVVPGDNYWAFNLKSGLRSKERFILVLTDAENKSHKLNFSINK